MNETEYTENSARLTLNTRLTTLAIWAERRTENAHDTATTLTILNRKVREIEEAVNRSRAESYSTYPIFQSNIEESRGDSR